MKAVLDDAFVAAGNVPTAFISNPRRVRRPGAEPVIGVIHHAPRPDRSSCDLPNPPQAVVALLDASRVSDTLHRIFPHTDMLLDIVKTRAAVMKLRAVSRIAFVEDIPTMITFAMC